MKLFFGMGMFKRAYEATRREIFTSLVILTFVRNHCGYLQKK